jgi:uncharacterized protein involved in exopolysaccharide biosynthesis
MEDMLKYLKIVRRWWWVIALLFVSTVGTIAALALLGEPQYAARATMHISTPPPQETPLYSQFYKQGIREEIEYTRTGLSELILEGDVPYRAVDLVPGVQMKGSELRDMITVDLPENSQLLILKVTVADPETAALLANAVVEAGIQRYGELLASSTTNTREFVEQELEAAQEELEAAEKEVTQFQIENKVGSLNSAIDSQHNLLRALRLELDLAQANRQSDKARALKEAILEREAELQNLVGLTTRYQELGDRLDRARDTYNFLSEQRTEAQIKENQILAAGFIQVITPAQPPRRPVATFDIKLTVLGAVASVLVGVLLAFLLEYLRTSSVLNGLFAEKHDSEIAATGGASPAE